VTGLYDKCFEALMASDVGHKRMLISALCQHDILSLSRDESSRPAQAVHFPGRPDKPELVHPRQLTRRKIGTADGLASFIHAIAHIEFNAINLALDAAYRFRDMPGEYYVDWLSVAAEEARHHQLLVDRLHQLDCKYGDFPAHNGLWDMAIRTDHDVLLRMALIPGVFEARGLDVTPPMIDRLERIGETESANILRLILREEVGHVAIGNRWYRFECERRGLDPDDTFISLVSEYLPGRKHGPFNLVDRRVAGFSDELTDRLGRIN
jgi:uncharacterized ferritin-like protein (DUF455 family)